MTITNSQVGFTLICWAVIAGLAVAVVASAVTVGTLWVTEHIK